DKKFRRQAAHAIGESKDRGALNTLQNLYDVVKEPDVRRAIIQAAGNNQEAEAAFSFLLKVARSEPDRDARRAAVRELGQFETDAAVGELMKIYSSETDVDVKRAALQGLAQTKSAKGQARLLEIARTDPNPELRRQAINRLSERG